jgi:hypothetical protein
MTIKLQSAHCCFSRVSQLLCVQIGLCTPANWASADAPVTDRS